MTLQPLQSSDPSGQLAPSGLTVQDQRRIQDALDSSTSPTPAAPTTRGLAAL